MSQAARKPYNQSSVRACCWPSSSQLVKQMRRVRDLLTLTRWLVEPIELEYNFCTLFYLLYIIYLLKDLKLKLETKLIDSIELKLIKKVTWLGSFMPLALTSSNFIYIVKILLWILPLQLLLYLFDGLIIEFLLLIHVLQNREQTHIEEELNYKKALILKLTKNSIG